MVPYTVSFLGPDEEVVTKEVRYFESDDHALDEIGRSDHPYAIQVHQGERIVARFPPWPPRRPTEL